MHSDFDVGFMICATHVSRLQSRREHTPRRSRREWDTPRSTSPLTGTGISSQNSTKQSPSLSARSSSRRTRSVRTISFTRHLAMGNELIRFGHRAGPRFAIQLVQGRCVRRSIHAVWTQPHQDRPEPASVGHEDPASRSGNSSPMGTPGAGWAHSSCTFRGTCNRRSSVTRPMPPTMLPRAAHPAVWAHCR